MCECFSFVFLRSRTFMGGIWRVALWVGILVNRILYELAGLIQAFFYFHQRGIRIPISSKPLDPSVHINLLHCPPSNPQSFITSPFPYPPSQLAYTTPHRQAHTIPPRPLCSPLHPQLQPQTPSAHTPAPRCQNSPAAAIRLVFPLPLPLSRFGELWMAG